MSNDFKHINSQTIDLYLKELGKEIRKDLGKAANVELIIVGGASIVLNYNFRDSTQDIDAYVSTRNSIKGAVNRVGDKFELPNDWLNQDFKNTKSFSEKLIEVSDYYKTFSNVLQVRTIKSEYLVAMKLASFRPYKHDESDIIGIVNEMRNNNQDVSFERFNEAVRVLYGEPNNISDEAIDFLKSIISNDRLPDKYFETAHLEKISGERLKEFDNKYPERLNESNIKEILASLLDEKDSADDSLQSALVRFIKSSEFSDDSENKEWAIINNQPNSLAVIKHNGDVVCTLYADNYGGIYVRSNDNHLTQTVVNIFNENGAKAFVDSINRANNIGL